MVPDIIEEKCTHCGQCVKGCVFNALAQVGEKILVFPQLCHGCGNCTLLCPVEAICERPREIGWLGLGKSQHGMDYLMGELTISEPMSTPIIRQLKAMRNNHHDISILDSPPGASCAVVATLDDVDFVLLVTEPTPFGLHDLKQILGILEHTNTPAGVIINRNGIGNDNLKNFVNGTQYPILLEIPYEEQIASGLAKGKLLLDIFPTYRNKFLELYEHIACMLEGQGGSR